MNYPYSLITIGASAGGLRPVAEIISRLPSQQHIYVVFIPHLYAENGSKLDSVLSKFTKLPVKWAENGEMLHPDVIYLLPQNKMMTVENGCFLLRDRKPDEIINQAIDLFLKSAALDAKNKAICVILSGGGQDGLLGAKEIHKQHGLVIVQEPNTAQFPFMPNAVIAADHPDYILSPEDIATIITHI
jgi:two-component system chemotaxis response regulator CheB